jgi:hypothetical protein
MSDEPTGVPAEGAPAEPTTSAPDLSAITDRMNELASQVGEIHSGWQEFRQAQQPPPEPEPDVWAGLFGEPQQPPEGVDQFGNPVQPAQPQMDPQAFQTAVNQAIQQANAPVVAQLQQLQLERATQQLYQQIPQLADKPENQEIRQATAERVQQSLAAYPPEIAQALMNDPAYVATVFKAAEAEKLAQGQAPAGEHAPVLEAAGGAHPGGDGTQQSIVELAHQGWSLPKGFR